MSLKQPSSHRPWYCIDGLVEEYREVAKGDGDLKMLKTLKIIRSILVIVAISAISLYALYLGADATVVAAFSLPSLAGYAGAEAADYAALVQGFLEAKQSEDNS
ncbi:hypothetical protein [Natronoarchaeum rubrum]|uniref:hypothetical protein n=1 Tax=Natronoarchaeum rubrum TaxID=755311 RepID=UPI002110F2B9|nr:hypothetical protein [Natronoarchaeum rubrum]